MYPEQSLQKHRDALFKPISSVFVTHWSLSIVRQFNLSCVITDYHIYKITSYPLKDIRFPNVLFYALPFPDLPHSGFDNHLSFAYQVSKICHNTEAKDPLILPATVS